MTRSRRSPEGQIEIDIRPALAPFREKTLEEQIAGDRIACRDPERIADHRVRGAPAPLHEDILRRAEIDDVPDDQKVTGKAELGDQVQLAIELRENLPSEVRIARARPGQCYFTKKRIHALALAHRVARELVAEILERKIEPRREADAFFHGLGKIGEKRGHLRAVLEMALIIRAEEPAGGVEMGVLAGAGEDVQHGALLALRVEHAIRRKQRDAPRAGQLHELRDGQFFATPQMALQLHIDISRAENREEPREHGLGAERIVRRQKTPQRPLFVAGQRDEAFGKGREFAPTDGRIGFRPAQPRLSHEAAKILVARTRGHEHRQDRAILHGQFAADDGLDPGLPRFRIKARRAIDAVPVAKRHRGQAQLRRAFRQVFRK